MVFKPCKCAKLAVNKPTGPAPMIAKSNFLIIKNSLLNTNIPTLTRIYVIGIFKIYNVKYLQKGGKVGNIINCRR